MAVCASPYSSRWLRRALVFAAALAALTAMAALAVFFSGIAGYDAAGRPENPLLYIHGSQVSDNYPRPRGTLVTGAMLTSVVATGLALLWFERELISDVWQRRLIYAVCVVALFFAFSRTIATFAIVLIAAELWRRDSPKWARGAWVIAAAAYAVALWVSLRYHVVLNPMEPWAVDVLAADGDRFGRWRSAVTVVAENPLVGIGPGVPVAEGWSAHNTWLNFWAGLGIVPLAAFAILMLASIRAAIGLRSLGVACALIFALIESTYNDIEDMRHVWLLIGIALSAGWVRNRGAAS
jgi:O-antigen ligase